MAQINKPNQYFNTKLYTGNGATNTVTGVGFQPDWTWIKNRTDSASNNLYDAVRGTLAGKLKSNTADAESYNASDLSTFGTDGFTVGGNNEVNGSGDAMASWNWLGANGTVANTDGSISSTVSANTTSGFSIVSYTGTGSNATVGHGLNSAPKMMIVKRRNATDVWRVYHSSIGATKHLVLNNNAAEATGSNVWNDTTPTSSVFSISTDSAVNASGSTYIAYCFAEKKGFSKFGNYFGNGNADGTFVYTGFKPAFIMIKDADNLEQWFIFDNKRNTLNVSKNLLYASDAGAETTSGANQIDILSNGFKMRSTNNGTNRSGGEGFTYMVFAEQPLVGTNNIPATAR